MGRRRGPEEEVPFRSRTEGTGVTGCPEGLRWDRRRGPHDRGRRRDEWGCGPWITGPVPSRRRGGRGRVLLWGGTVVVDQTLGFHSHLSRLLTSYLHGQLRVFARPPYLLHTHLLSHGCLEPRHLLVGVRGRVGVRGCESGRVTSGSSTVFGLGPAYAADEPRPSTRPWYAHHGRGEAKTPKCRPRPSPAVPDGPPERGEKGRGPGDPRKESTFGLVGKVTDRISGGPRSTSVLPLGGGGEGPVDLARHGRLGTGRRGGKGLSYQPRQRTPVLVGPCRSRTVNTSSHRSLLRGPPFWVSEGKGPPAPVRGPWVPVSVSLLWLSLLCLWTGGRASVLALRLTFDTFFRGRTRSPSS